jgi:hypothetical protein
MGLGIWGEKSRNMGRKVQKYGAKGPEIWGERSRNMGKVQGYGEEYRDMGKKVEWL